MTTATRPAAVRTAPALRQLALAGAGAVLAASAWAAGIQEQGFVADERLWREEVAFADDGEGWYALTVGGDAVQVRAGRPACHEAASSGKVLYVNVPGAALAEGVRLNYLFEDGGFRPTVGQTYRFSMGRTELRFSVESSEAGTQYVIQYGGTTHNYLLGLPAAATQVHAIVDLDGDRRPDFVVEVGSQVFLLLSSQARPGSNLPSARLWAA